MIDPGPAFYGLLIVGQHLSLDKNAPVRRIIQRAGRIEVRPILFGLENAALSDVSG
jgi:hypothetical protein